MSFQQTPEQEAILSAATSSETSLMISALAGCGKTSTLELIAHALPKKRSLALAFNVKIKKELESRFPPHFEVKTMNGLGHGAWMRAIGKSVQLVDNKIGTLISSAIKLYQLDRDLWQDLKTLVTAAMQAGLTPSIFPVKGLLPDTPESWQSLADDAFLSLPPDILPLAREILIESINMGFGTSGPATICFDDQIYLPTLFNGQYPRFETVLVDEAQDLSPLNHLQVAKVAGPSGRLIICGDPRQAIYAFRGADSQSMGKLKGLRREWIELPLQTTFRCPKSVVDRQKEHAPGFNAAPTAPVGTFHDWQGQGWQFADLADLRPHPRAAIAILCRNNAPLLAIAMRLIKAGVGPIMLGRDIGKSLVALSKKILPGDETPAEVCRDMVEKWAEREELNAQASGKDGKIAGITDRKECLLAVLESVATAKDLRARIEYIFSNEKGQVTLATGHRSKGLEWEIVVHLDPWRIPSKYAKREAGKGNPSSLEQEFNLKYVIETRSKSVLVLANLESFL